MTMKLNLRNRFSDFRFFYSYLKNKIFFALTLSFFVGLLDGLGLAMFIPLLQLVGGGGEFEASSENIGNLSYFIYALNWMGLSLNLSTALLLILFFFSLKGVFRFMEYYYSMILTINFIKQVRIEAVRKITDLNYRFFIKLDSGKIQNTLSGEIDRLRLSFVNYSAAIQSFIAAMVYIGLAFLTNSQFALLVASGGLISNFLYTKLYKKTKETSREITSSSHVFHGLMIQQIQNFKYLRATGRVALYSDKINKAIINIAKGFKKIGFFNSLLIAIKEPLSIAVVVVVIFVQTYFFSSELGPIILSLLFFYRSLNQLIVFQNYWNNFMNYSGSLENYKEFKVELDRNKIDYNKGLFVEEIDTVELNKLNFSYDDKQFLTEINFKIQKNHTIAFVGPSGSGKTTLSNIIAGLLPVAGRQLLVNGNPLNKCNIQQYQSRIGYITQEPAIFDDTLFNNITFWAEKNSESILRFKDCIEKAALTELLESHELKEDMPLGSSGVMVSGGQKQRIAIARELYKEVDLLIMDEATSALDSGTEKEIQNYFEQLQGSFTIIVIAHRLSTIKNANTIYLLDEGKVLAHGDFYSLQEKSSEFKKMVELQDFGVVH